MRPLVPFLAALSLIGCQLGAGALHIDDGENGGGDDGLNDGPIGFEPGGVDRPRWGENGQFGEEDTGFTGGGCEAGESTPLSLDDPTALGFTAREAIEVMVGEWSETLSWSTGGEVALTHTLTYVGDSAVFTPYEASSGGAGGSGDDTAILCEDAIGFEVDITFATADGAFDERWSVKLETRSAEHLSYTQPLTSLSGELTFGDADLIVSAWFSAEGGSGEIAARALTTGEPTDTGEDVGVTETTETIAWW